MTKVLDGQLKDKEYLVGSKATYADLAFIPWYAGFRAAPELWSELQQANPHWSAWMQRLLERPAVKKALDEKAKASGH